VSVGERNRDGRRPEHWVSPEPFDPYVAEILTPEQERFYMASQWRLMWWKLSRHPLAVASGAFLAALYLSILFSEFLAPHDLHKRHTRFIHAPPQAVHLFHGDEYLGPFVYGYTLSRDLRLMKRVYTEDQSQIYRIGWFCQGDRYKFWDLFNARLHLFCAIESRPDGSTRVHPIFLLGTDRLGRDMLSRIIYGARISLTIGLIGIAISFAIGLTLGGLAGYYGGWVDNVVQRLIEMLRSFPELPLWMALSAALPVTWSPVAVFLGITMILGFLDWPGLARAVRSKLLALREEDYAQAATLMGASPRRVIARHLLPNFMSHLIASLTLSIPSMILGETALSFLGLGLRPPVTSWGVLLNEAQDINAVATYPWLILPMVPVVLVVLAFNFLGDGLRDAADPYK
jgi:peptide/nickel transport system permease protein